MCASGSRAIRTAGARDATAGAIRGSSPFAIRRAKKDDPSLALKILLCDCASVGQNEFAHLEEQITKRFDDVNYLQRAYAVELDRRLEVTFRHTFFGAFKILWRAAAKRISRKPKTVPAAPNGEKLP